MKKSIIMCFAAAGLMLVGCAESKDVKIASQGEETTLQSPYDVVNVDAVEGAATIVKQGGDTIAVCLAPQAILAPANTDLIYETVTYETITDANGNNRLIDRYGNILTERNQLYEVIAFEDSKVGDYDYNDLVVHARVIYSRAQNKIEITPQPIALGATKNFGVGVSIGYLDDNGNRHSIDDDWLLAEDVRTELFDGAAGFINTVNGGTFKKYPAKAPVTHEMTLPAGNNVTMTMDWYILVGGEKIYAVSKYFYCAQKSNLRPYGLTMTNIRQNNIGFYYSGSDCGYDWWNYPQERTNIDEVYDFSQNFFQGLLGDFTKFDTPKTGLFFDAIGRNAGVMNGKNDIKGTSYEDKCLYAITFPASTIK